MDLSTPKVMGIVNVTPDSFYDGGKNKTEKQLLKHVEKMISEGAAFIDVGGMSSRPGAKTISEQEELKRVIPAISLIHKKFPKVIISVDTFRAKVAEKAVSAGASMINDISAGAFDKKMFTTIARLKVPYVLMHMKGTPPAMQKNPTYKDVMGEITEFFIKKLKTITQLGINDVILDPGFGFGKTLAHNYEILRNLPDLRIFGLPIMAGISRKSIVCRALNVNPPNALNGTTALHAVALLNGAGILRVHDVKEANEVIRLIEFIVNPKS